MDRLRPVRRALRGAEAAQVRWFGRSLLSTMFRTPALVLETVGRRSGQRRRTALAYHRLADDGFVVVGGAGGQRRVPDWVANVRADPRVGVVVDRVQRPMVAVELHGDVRARVWDEVRQVWPRIERYEERAGRRIPVFRLQDVGAAGSSPHAVGRGTVDAVPIGRLDVTAIDCPHPAELAEFYRSLLGGRIIENPENSGWIELHTDGGRLAFQQIDDHRRPTWPDGDVPQQAHVDIDVDDLSTAEGDAIQLGAVKADFQPSPDDFRVFLDPAGHPFCLVRSGPASSS